MPDLAWTEECNMDLTTASDKAFSKIDKLFGTDDDLNIYNNLSEADLSAISDEYGIEEVTKYVQSMEFRRLNNAKNTTG